MKVMPIGKYVWASHKLPPDPSAHKQGKVIKEFVPRIIGNNAYLPMVEIAPVPDFMSIEPQPNYPYYWIDTRDLEERTVTPAPAPVEAQPTELAIGMAFVMICKWFASLFK